MAVDDLCIPPIEYLVDGRRGRGFGDSVKLLPESAVPDWCASGQRTARWLVQAIAARATRRCRGTTGGETSKGSLFTASDAFVDDHCFISELLETGLSYMWARSRSSS